MRQRVKQFIAVVLSLTIASEVIAFPSPGKMTRQVTPWPHVFFLNQALSAPEIFDPFSPFDAKQTHRTYQEIGAMSPQSWKKGVWPMVVASISSTIVLSMLDVVSQVLHGQGHFWIPSMVIGAPIAGFGLIAITVPAMKLLLNVGGRLDTSLGISEPPKMAGFDSVVSDPDTLFDRRLGRTLLMNQSLAALLDPKFTKSGFKRFWNQADEQQTLLTRMMAELGLIDVERAVNSEGRSGVQGYTPGPNHKNGDSWLEDWWDSRLWIPQGNSDVLQTTRATRDSSEIRSLESRFVIGFENITRRRPPTALMFLLSRRLRAGAFDPILLDQYLDRISRASNLQDPRFLTSEFDHFLRTYNHVEEIRAGRALLNPTEGIRMEIRDPVKAYWAEELINKEKISEDIVLKLRSIHLNFPIPTIIRDIFDNYPDFAGHNPYTLLPRLLGYLKGTPTSPLSRAVYDLMYSRIFFSRSNGRLEISADEEDIRPLRDELRRAYNLSNEEYMDLGLTLSIIESISRAQHGLVYGRWNGEAISTTDAAWVRPSDLQGNLTFEGFEAHEMPQLSPSMETNERREIVVKWLKTITLDDGPLVETRSAPAFDLRFVKPDHPARDTPQEQAVAQDWEENPALLAGGYSIPLSLAIHLLEEGQFNTAVQFQGFSDDERPHVFAPMRDRPKIVDWLKQFAGSRAGRIAAILTPNDELIIVKANESADRPDSAGAITGLYRLANWIHQLLNRGEILSEEKWIEDWAPKWEEGFFTAFLLPAGAILGAFLMPAVFMPGFFHLAASALAGLGAAYVVGNAVFALLHAFGKVYRYDPAKHNWFEDDPKPADIRDLTLAGFRFRSVAVGVMGLLVLGGGALLSHLAIAGPGQAVSYAATLVLGGLIGWWSATQLHQQYNQSIKGNYRAAATYSSDQPVDQSQSSIGDILKPFAAWVYKEVKPIGWRISPATRLRITSTEASLQNPFNQAEFHHWSAESASLTILRKANVSNIQIPSRYWNTEEEVLEFLIEAVIQSRSFEEVSTPLATDIINREDPAALQRFLVRPRAEEVMMHSLPTAPVYLEKLGERSPEFLTIVVEHLWSLCRSPDSAIAAKARDLYLGLVRAHLKSNRIDKVRSILIAHFDQMPVEYTLNQHIEFSGLAFAIGDENLGFQWLEVSLNSLLQHLQSPVSYRAARPNVLELLSFIRNVTGKDPLALHQIINQKILAGLRTAIVFGLNEIAEPSQRKNAITDMAQALRILHNYDLSAFAHFQAAWCKSPFPHLSDPDGPSVQQHYIDTVLDLASQADPTSNGSPQAYLPIVQTLTAQLELYPLYQRSDDDYPWVAYSLIMNMLHTSAEYEVYYRLASHLFDGFAGNIGTSISGEIRNMSRRDDYDTGLAGFIRGEIHLRYGPSNLTLMEHVMTALRTGNGHDLGVFMTNRGFGSLYHQWSLHQQADHRNEFRANGGGPDDFFRVHIEIQTLFKLASDVLGIPENDMIAKDLLRLTPAQWEEVRRRAGVLEDKLLRSAVLAQIDSGDVRIYRLLNERYNPLNLEGLRTRVATLRLPGEIKEQVLVLVKAMSDSDDIWTLYSLLALHVLVRQAILQPTPFDPETIGDERQEYLQSRRNDTGDVVQSMGSYYPADSKFNLLELDLLIEEVSRFVLGRMRDKAFADHLHPDYRVALEVLSYDLRCLNTMGFGVQALEDMVDLLAIRGSSFTLARLRLLSRRILNLMDFVYHDLDIRYAVVVEHEIHRFMPGQLVAHLAAIESEDGKLRSRLPTHVINQMVFASAVLNSLQSVASLTLECVKFSGMSELLRPLFGQSPFINELYILNPAQERTANRGIPLTPNQREGLGEKGANIVRGARNIPEMNQPPALEAPIGMSLSDMIQKLLSNLPKLENLVRENLVITQDGSLESMHLFTGSTFGKDMTVSVRSGGLFDLPGLLLTITDVGICVEGPYRNIERFEARLGRYGAWDSYRHFVQEFGMAHGIPREQFSNIIESAKLRLNRETKIQFSGDEMRTIALEYQRLAEQRGITIPQDPERQLVDSIRLVYQSWASTRAQEFLKTQYMEWELGTVVIIQPMVSGNMRDQNGQPVFSGAGAVYTTNALNGNGDEEILFDGSFNMFVDGTDIADGVVRPGDVHELLSLNRPLYNQLKTILIRAAHIAHHDTEIEFTIQNGCLFGLQLRYDPPQGKFSQFKEPLPKAIASGEGLTGGALSGIAVTEDALQNPRWFQELLKLGEQHGIGLIVFLEGAPPDITYLLQGEGVKGFVAARGGKGQHSQRIAHKLGLTAIAGVRAMEIIRLEHENTIFFNRDSDSEKEVKVGDFVSIDGQAGFIYSGLLETVNQRVAQSSDKTKRGDPIRDHTKASSMVLNQNKIEGIIYEYLMKFDRAIDAGMEEIGQSISGGKILMITKETGHYVHMELNAAGHLVDLFVPIFVKLTGQEIGRVLTVVPRVVQQDWADRHDLRVAA